MLKEELKSLKRLSLTSSVMFTEIMEKYDLFGRSMPMTTFHKKYVAPLDSSITLRKWDTFVKKFERVQKNHVEQRLKESTEKAVTAAQLEGRSLDKVLQIADVSLKALVDNPEMMASIPMNTRVRWLFSAMKARDSRLKTNVLMRQEERQQSMFEKMMEGAQYGGFVEGEVPEAKDSDQTEILNAMENIENGEEQPVSHELPGAV